MSTVPDVFLATAFPVSAKLAMAKDLCSKLVYLNKANTVILFYDN